MDSNDQIQSALQVLETAGYTCLAPCPKHEGYESYGDTPPEPLFLGKVIDCETNGAHETAKIFEIGIVTFDKKGARRSRISLAESNAKILLSRRSRIIYGTPFLSASTRVSRTSVLAEQRSQIICGEYGPVEPGPAADD